MRRYAAITITAAISKSIVVLLAGTGAGAKAAQQVTVHTSPEHDCTHCNGGARQTSVPFTIEQIGGGDGAHVSFEIMGLS